MSLHLKLLLATIFWGATPTIGRMLAEYGAPFAIVFGRFLISSMLLMWFLFAAKQFVRIPRKYWLHFLWLGATGVLLHNGLMFKGLEYTSATNGSIILGLIAMQVVILDYVFYRRRADRLALLGVFLGFLGAAVVITKGDLKYFAEIGLGRGEVLMFLSALAWAIYSVAGRSVLEIYSPLLVTTVASVAGLLLVAPFLFDQPAAAAAMFSDTHAVLLIAFLGVIGSGLGFLWYYQAVARLGTVGAALYINLIPVFGVIIAASSLDEPIGISVVVGGAMVVVALALVNRPQAVAAAK